MDAPPYCHIVYHFKHLDIPIQKYKTTCLVSFLSHDSIINTCISHVRIPWWKKYNIVRQQLLFDYAQNLMFNSLNNLFAELLSLVFSRLLLLTWCLCSFSFALDYCYLKFQHIVTVAGGLWECWWLESGTVKCLAKDCTDSCSCSSSFWQT